MWSVAGQNEAFQHAAARRWLTLVALLKCFRDWVSTRSRPKVAESYPKKVNKPKRVSTRSRPKVAEQFSAITATID